MFRIPADWNCFFDGCFNDLKTDILKVVDTDFIGINNICAFFGGNFSPNLPFDTELKELLTCYLAIVRGTDFLHYSEDRQPITLMISYSILYLDDPSATYTGIF